MDANGSRAYVPYHVTENSMNIVPNWKLYTIENVKKKKGLTSTS